MQILATISRNNLFDVLTKRFPVSACVDGQRKEIGEVVEVQDRPSGQHVLMEITDKAVADAIKGEASHSYTVENPPEVIPYA